MGQTRLFNDDWRFHKGEAEGAEAPGFDDAGWRAVTLPHDWSIEGPFDPQWASGTGFLPVGVGWYRKAFSLPPGEAGRQTALRFEGVYCGSDVWVNGQHLGSRPSGYASFDCDLTPHLRADGPNVVAVRADHTLYADSRWYTGSGIYRDVWLLTTGPVRVRPGSLFVTTPVVCADRAEVHAAATIENRTAQAAEVSVEHRLVDAGGAVAARAGASLSVPPGGAGDARAVLEVPRPQLWSVERPALYVLETVLRVGGAVADSEQTTVGIRSIRFDPDQGFFLNGEGLKLRGVCVHDDAGALGTAVPPRVWERRLETLKAGGVNAIRMAHNPHLPALYDLCDRLGVLVQDEAFDEWEGGKRKWRHGHNVGEAGTDGPHSHFAEWGEADLEAMVRRDRNHPSVIMWSIGNEIDYPNDPYTHEILDSAENPQVAYLKFHPERPHADRLGVVARRLAAIVRGLDPTRPVTAGLAAAQISSLTGFADALDVAGYNYQEYLYPGDHARYPARVLLGSENGMRWEFWEAVAANPYVAGQFLWTGIDYLGEAPRWPGRSSGAGLLDLAGLPKPEYFYRQSLWTDAPMVRLGTSPIPTGDESVNPWTHRSAERVWRGGDGAPVRVSVFTNCDAAELFVNGRSVGVRERADFPDRALWWDIPAEPGTLSVRGLWAGAVAATDELRTAGPAARLIAQADRSVIRADGRDLAHVTVEAVDAHGTAVYDDAPEVAWALTGPVRLLGLESGDHASHEDYQAPRRRLYRGRQLGYVQSTHAPGPVEIRLSAPGLEGTVVQLRTE